MMPKEAKSQVRSELVIEHEKLLAKIAKWQRASIGYRWSNIFLFMTCKIVVPTGALIIAINMISIVLDKSLIDSFWSAILAIIITFLASIEAMLNPGAKKRLAFNFYNELNSIENRMNISRITSSDDEFKVLLVSIDQELKTLLNKYSDNGY